MIGRWDGMLLVDKPVGPTSHDLVALTRRVTGQRRIGHAGTLDPPASGLLPLVLGGATRLVRFLPTGPKVYTGLFQLGLTTQSDDLAGEVLSVHEGPLPGGPAVVAAASSLEGRSLQVPPRVSARKVGGRRLYELTRRGVEVERRASEVEVGGFQITPTHRANTFGFRVEVSGGTYVRALVRDLGSLLGCGATLAGLRRTRIGPLGVEQALPLDRDDPPAAERLALHLVPLASMPLVPPAVQLETPRDAERFSHGQAVVPGAQAPPGTVRVLAPGGELLGVAETREGLLRPLVVLPTRRAAV